MRALKGFIFIIIILFCGCKALLPNNTVNNSLPEFAMIKKGNVYYANPDFTFMVQREIESKFSYKNINDVNTEWRGVVIMELFYNEHGSIKKINILSRSDPKDIVKEAERCAYCTRLNINLEDNTLLRVIAFVDLSERRFHQIAERDSLTGLTKSH